MAGVCAVLLMVVLCGRYIQAGRALRESQLALAASRQNWETTAAEKETLQAELSQVENEVKEAALTLQESTDRAAQLEAELAALRQEIDALNAQKP